MNIILGVGSSFADDQAGWLVARQLMTECKSKIRQGELLVKEIDRPGINLLQWLEEDYRNLFLIDLVKTNLVEAGNIYVLQGNEILGFSGMLSSHSFGIANSLGLAQILGIDITKVTFWGLEGKSADLESEISNEILAAVPQLTQQIVTRLLAEI